MHIMFMYTYYRYIIVEQISAFWFVRHSCDRIVDSCDRIVDSCDRIVVLVTSLVHTSMMGCTHTWRYIHRTMFGIPEQPHTHSF